jgi:hypothetical protein
MLDADVPRTYVYLVLTEKNALQRNFPDTVDIEAKGSAELRFNQVGKVLGGIAMGAVAGLGFRSPHTQKDAMRLVGAGTDTIRNAMCDNTGFTSLSDAPGRQCVFSKSIPAADVAYQVTVERGASDYSRLTPKGSKEKIWDKQVVSGVTMTVEPVFIVSTIPPEHAGQDGLRGGVGFYSLEAAQRFKQMQQPFIAEKMGHLAEHTYHRFYTAAGKLRDIQTTPTPFFMVARRQATRELATARQSLQETLEAVAPPSLPKRALSAIGEGYFSNVWLKGNPLAFLGTYQLVQGIEGVDFDFQGALGKTLSAGEQHNLEAALNKVVGAQLALDETNAAQEKMADAYNARNASKLCLSEINATLRYKENQLELVLNKIETLRQYAAKHPDDAAPIQVKIDDMQTRVERLRADIETFKGVREARLATIAEAKAGAGATAAAVDELVAEFDEAAADEAVADEAAADEAVADEAVADEAAAPAPGAEANDGKAETDSEPEDSAEADADAEATEGPPQPGGR